MRLILNFRDSIFESVSSLQNDIKSVETTAKKLANDPSISWLAIETEVLPALKNASRQCFFLINHRSDDDTAKSFVANAVALTSYAAHRLFLSSLVRVGTAAHELFSLLTRTAQKILELMPRLEPVQIPLFALKAKGSDESKPILACVAKALLKSPDEVRRRKRVNPQPEWVQLSLFA